MFQFRYKPRHSGTPLDGGYVKSVILAPTMPKVKIRRFDVELKHRPPDDTTGEQEQLIATITLEVPRLANSDWEKRWAALCVWNLLSSDEAKEKGINQAFIFTAGYSDIIMRLEVNPFQDEEVKKLDPPSQKEHDIWHEKVQKRFAQLYNLKLSEWIKTRKFID